MVLSRSIAIIMFVLLAAFGVRRMLSAKVKRLTVSNANVSTKALQYRIRRAKKEDIANIDTCNKRNLPENYSYNFFFNHLLRWPDLSLIAETEKSEMIGYALGRVDISKHDALSFPGFNPPQTCGHIASLAVHSEFRGNGVAQSLMKELHQTFALNYGIDTVTLYCRVSNTAALKLYSDSLKYECTHLSNEYYDDKEDAWYMSLDGLLSKHLPPSVSISTNSDELISLNAK